MNLKPGLRSVLCAFAVAVVLMNLSAVVPAAASPHHCQTAHDDGSVDHHDDTDVQAGCCGSMHCCPMLPHLPSPRLPSAIQDRPHSHVKVEQPLLLVTSIDPPPRPLAT
ncbi:hypothetical protein [Neorhizobium]|jgi:hypothetical protein|uniref:hypothetical protein n=1 Tax=Neorhizobium TaxID=1525371 RepID=UPI000CF9C656|nr:hypothetical protein [Neorhizobium]